MGDPKAVVAPEVSVETVFDASDAAPCVTVFGASRAAAGSATYEASVAVGAALARLGCVVVNGGYTGVMEASAAGATGAGGRAYGIVVPSVFVERHRRGGANAHLTGAVHAPSLAERVDLLCHGARGKGITFFVVMPGTLGTLHEFATVWDEVNVAQFSGARAPVIFAWRDPWEALVRSMYDSLDMRCPALLDAVTFVDSAEDLEEKVRARPDLLMSVKSENK